MWRSRPLEGVTSKVLWSLITVLIDCSVGEIWTIESRTLLMVSLSKNYDQLNWIFCSKSIRVILCVLHLVSPFCHTVINKGVKWLWKNMGSISPLHFVASQIYPGLVSWFFLRCSSPSIDGSCQTSFRLNFSCNFPEELIQMTLDLKVWHL